MEFSIDFNKHYISVYEKNITKFEHILTDSDLTDRLYYEKTYYEILSKLYITENDDTYDSVQNFISEMNKDIPADKCKDFPYLLGLLNGYYKIFLIKIKSAEKDIYINEAIEFLHGYAIELNDLYDELATCKEDFDVIPYSLSAKIHNEMDILYQSINPITDNLKSYFLSSRHGGARLNAGIKKSQRVK